MLRLGPWLCLPLLVATAGCDAPVPDPEPTPSPAVALGGSFDPATAGSITGRVTWDGSIPSFPSIVAPVFLPTGVEQRRHPHPNTPDIDPATRAVRGAVIYLDGVDPRRAKPWDYPPARVEVHDDRIAIMQASGESRIGFARRGDIIEVVSKDAAVHVLSARGAAFFGLPLPDPDQPVRRTLNDAGVVDLSSAAGKYWHRAYLFVADHPYCALTDAEGRFTLANVPPGEYTLKCWLPNGAVERNERDPNTGLILRFVHSPPLETTQAVHVGIADRLIVRMRLAK
jgi:hypothetical protein